MATHHHGRLPASCIVTAVVFLVSTFTPLEVVEAGDPVGHICGNSSSYYTVNGTYHANIHRLAATLPANASSSSSSGSRKLKLFATVAIGEAPDVVYALALCRGDSDPPGGCRCRDCVAAAFPDAQLRCPYNRDVTVFYGFCLVRYSDQDFLASPDSGSDDVLFLGNTQNVSAPFEAFDAAVAVLLNATADYAASISSDRYGTAVEEFQTFDSNKPSIYGQAQCTPDMAPADCRSCLGGIIRKGRKYFSGKQGGRVLSVRCSYRFEQYPFFTGAPLLQLPEPPLGALMTPAPEMASQMLPTARRGRETTRRVVATALRIVVVLLVLITAAICSYFWRKSKTSRKPSLLPEDIQTIDSLMIDLSTLRAATKNFDQANKLGEGGFGAVYKGILPDAQEIAVKRLSQSSRQGIEELRNELVLVAKLQQKNLVRLVGLCLEDNEKLLVYEYMPNKSLDTILFDPVRCTELDWGKRLKIINGIARGLQYLHEDSQVKIIHRDLKTSNVLLDYDFNPKISDFGLARLFTSDQSQYTTNHVAGTYGYMAPEYAMRGHYSVKSDVFSFGVLILEIVTGRRNGGFNSTDEYADLLSLVWEHWMMGTPMKIMNLSLNSNLFLRDQMLKCIHIGLLCVQEDPADRPMMSTVIVMLNASMVTLQDPSKPAFYIRKGYLSSSMHSKVCSRGSQRTSRLPFSENNISITVLEPR